MLEFKGESPPDGPKARRRGGRALKFQQCSKPELNSYYNTSQHYLEQVFASKPTEKQPKISEMVLQPSVASRYNPPLLLLFFGCLISLTPSLIPPTTVA